jgi:gamma-glutamylcyclotransferase (GGCT)/AIG2-like uncharacterized protein YtfP
MKQWMFCYGTLMLPRVMAAVVGRRLVAVPALLPGFCSRLLRGRDYPAIWPDPDQSVPGVLYVLHHRRDLGRLDRYEGREYQRRQLPVSGPNGPVRAWVYLPRGGRRRLSGQPWSALHFEQRTLRRQLRRIPAWRRSGIAHGDDAPA